LTIIACLDRKPFYSAYSITEAIGVSQFQKGNLIPDSPRASRFMLRLDNCRVHFSKCPEAFFDENSFRRVPQLAYLPEFVPSDFSVIGELHCNGVSSKLQSSFLRESMTLRARYNHLN
jgi:hypothetical protein